MPPTGRVYVNPNGANIYIEGEDTGDTSSSRFIGGSGSILPDPVYFSSSSNTSDPFIQTSFIYANKVFKEWNTFRDGSGSSYSIGEIINTTISTTLFAIWEEIPYNVTISYKGSIIAGMSSSGTKTLETEGTYCEDDIAFSVLFPTLDTSDATVTTSYMRASKTAYGANGKITGTIPNFNGSITIT